MKIKHNLYFASIIFSVLFTFMQPLHAQTCRDNITPTTPTQDFILHDDGTVTHRKTGLMWMRCALGQNWNGAGCTGSGQVYTWAGALQAAEGFNFAGHSDWRLPDIKELASIVEQACFNPAINTTVFSGTPLTHFWTASPSAVDVLNAWRVNFSNGHDSIVVSKTNNDRVRLVRGGQ